MEAHINKIDLSSFSLLLLLVLSAVFFLYAKHYGKRKSQVHLPPGSMGWPYIGETIAYYKKHPSYSLGHYLQNRIHRYGKIFKSNLLGEPTIVSVDAEFNQFILRNEGRFFKTSYPECFTQIFGETSLLALNGERHKELRSIVLKYLSRDMLRTRFLPDVEQLAVFIINMWKDGMFLSAREEAIKFTFYMAAKNIMNMEPGKSETEKIRREYTTLMQGTVSIPLKFPGTPYWKALKSKSEIYSVIGRNMDSRIKKIGQGDMKGNNDMLCWCLTEPKLSKEQILNLVFSMIFAAYETMSVALSVAIFFLSHFPKAFQELRGEHLRISKQKTERGDTKLNWEDYKKMEFTECVVKETLRLANIAKSLPRKAIQDVHYKGHDIPCGWKVFLILSAVHLDGSIHKDPQEFNPWRWKNKSASAVEFMPFGSGNHLCPGAEAAKMGLAVFLHHLVLNYRWELGKHDEPLAFPYVEFEKGLPIQVFKISKHT